MQQYRRQEELPRERPEEFEFPVELRRELGPKQVKERQLTLQLIPHEDRLLLKDFLYLLQHVNSLYTILLQISKGDYNSAILRVSYRNRFEAVDLPAQLTLVKIAQRSPIIFQLKGIATDIVEALKRLIELPWQAKYDIEQMRLERDERQQRIRHREDIHQRQIQRLSEAARKEVLIIREVYKVELTDEQIDRLTLTLGYDLNRLAENPNKIKVED